MILLSLWLILTSWCEFLLLSSLFCLLSFFFTVLLGSRAAVSSLLKGDDGSPGLRRCHVKVLDSAPDPRHE